MVIKIGVAILTIGITIMNITMVNSYEKGVKDKAEWPSPATQGAVFDKPASTPSAPWGTSDTAKYKSANLQNTSFPHMGNQPSRELDTRDSFTSLPVPEDVKSRMMGNSYGAKAEISFEELRYIKVLYYDFSGKICAGELIVNKAVSADVMEIFKTLYDKKYPIATMVLIDEFKGNDNLSMAANNTSSFCWRDVDGSKVLSMHAFGLAVDLNPVQNPMVTTGANGTQEIKPPEGAAYLDRASQVTGLIVKGDVCYDAFISHGWEWGGEWTTMKDYQHFYKNVPGYEQQ